MPEGVSTEKLLAVNPVVTGMSLCVCNCVDVSSLRCLEPSQVEISSVLFRRAGLVIVMNCEWKAAVFSDGLLTASVIADRRQVAIDHSGLGWFVL